MRGRGGANRPAGNRAAHFFIAWGPTQRARAFGRRPRGPPANLTSDPRPLAIGGALPNERGPAAIIRDERQLTLDISTTALRRPAALAPGARVALVAPAGPLRGEADLERAVHNARALGFEPEPAPHALARRGYFAGDDAERLTDLNRALADDAVDGVWCLRGGYGAMRILDDVDYDAIRRRPKTLLGYSDITALHAAVGRRAGVLTFHGPTARAELSDFSRRSLERALAHEGDPCGATRETRTLRPGRARGILAGGNLALLAALVGTPYAPSYDGAILVLEDVNEAVYRVDRMLRQLLLSDALRGVRAIAFGQCTDCPAESDDGARTLDEVVAEAADVLRVPCVSGLPFGHVADQWTLPLGALAELDADAGTLHVDW